MNSPERFKANGKQMIKSFLSYDPESVWRKKIISDIMAAGGHLGYPIWLKNDRDLYRHDYEQPWKFQGKR